MLQGGHQGEIRHTFWRLRFTELNEIFIFMTLRSFALALVAIFIPIYLYVLGYGLKGVFIFYLAMFLAEMLFEYPVANWIKRFGPKHMITYSIPFLILHFFMLLTLPVYGWSLFAVGVVGGVTLALYWQSYHYDFSRAKHRKKASAEIGRLHIVLAFVGSMAPFVGGYLATSYGMMAVYLLVMVLLLVATFTLFKTGDNNFRPGRLDFSKIEIKDISRDLVAYGGNMIETCATAHIWPLFLFLIVGSYKKVGLITSAALILTVVVTFYVSRNSDSGKRVGFVRIGGFLSGLTSFIKIFVTTLPQAFGVNLAKSVASSFFASPFISEYYIHADERRRSEYIYLMETANDFAKLLYYLVLLLLLNWFSEPMVLTIGLVLGAFGAFAAMMMPAAKCEVCGQIENQKIKVMGRVN